MDLEPGMGHDNLVHQQAEEMLAAAVVKTIEASPD